MEHHQITVGLLPFGLSHPQAEKIAAALAAQGFAVLRTPADCTQKTPAEIVRRLVADGSDCIVAQSSAELETAEVPVITANPSSVNSTVDFVRAVAAARALPGMRVASIGGSFDGMGDFLISVEEIKREFEVEVIYANSDELRACREAITDKAVTDEIALDLARRQTHGRVFPRRARALDPRLPCVAALARADRHRRIHRQFPQNRQALRP